MSAKNLILFLFPMFLLTPARAREPLTLARCQVLSQDRSGDLAVQSRRVEEARERLVQARGALLPEVRFAYSRFERDDAGGAVTPNGSDSRFAASQPLFAGFRLAGGMRLAKSELAREELNAESIARNLRAQVTQAFYTLAQAEADAANIRAVEAALRERRGELAERVRLGKSRESEVLTVESQIASLLAQRKLAEGSRQRAAETLSFLTGVPAGEITILDDTPAASAPASVERYLAALEGRSDLLAFGRDVESQRARLAVARGGLLPSLALTGSWYTSRSGSLAGSDWETLLSLDVPLFKGGAARGKVNEERSRLAETEARLDLARRQAATEIRQLHAALSASLEQAAALGEAYARTRKSYELQMRDYRFGLVNNLDVLSTIQTMLDVKRSLDRALLQAKSDRAVLDIAAMQ